MLSMFQRKRREVVEQHTIGPREVLLDQKDIKISEHSLGSGRFGSVVQGEWLGQQVAIKRIVPAQEADPHTKKLLEAELSKLLPHVHPNILPIYGLVELPEGGLWLVLKHGKQGSLSDLLRNSGWRGRDRGCPRKVAVHIAKGVCSALAYLHSQNPPIVYRDLKPGNVIVSGGYTPLLDPEFGAVRTVLSEIVALRTRTNTSQGTGTKVSDAAYHAPECLTAGKPDDWQPPSDIYSLGQLLFDMVTGFPPFANMSEADVAKALLAKQRPTLPSRMHSRLASIIESCWAENPADRPSARVLLQVFSDLETEFADDEDANVSEYVGTRASRGASASASASPAGIAGLAGGVVSPPPAGLAVTSSFRLDVSGGEGGSAVKGTRATIMDPSTFTPTDEQGQEAGLEGDNGTQQ